MLLIHTVSRFKQISQSETFSTLESKIKDYTFLKFLVMFLLLIYLLICLLEHPQLPAQHDRAPAPKLNPVRSPGSWHFWPTKKWKVKSL